MINFVLLDEMLSLEIQIYGTQCLSSVCSEKSICDGRIRLLKAGERRIAHILNTVMPLVVASSDPECINLLLMLQDMFQDNLIEITRLWEKWTPSKAVADLAGYRLAHRQQSMIAREWMKSERLIIDRILDIVGHSNPQPIAAELHDTIGMLAHVHDRLPGLQDEAHPY